MKTIYFIFALTVFFLTGCDSFIDLQNPTEITNTTFWKTSNDAEQGLAAVYSGLKQRFLYNDQGIKNMNMRGDDLVARRQNPNIYNPDLFINTPSNSFALNMWSQAYIVIYRANQVIDNVPEIVMDETRKAEIIAEAQFLRGLSYFILINNFYTLPLSLKSSPENDEMFPESASRETIWNQIVTDLNAAKKAVPESVEENNKGRATKFAAAAFLGKVYLYQEKYSDAIAEFEYILDNGNYSLLRDVNDNFSDKNENNEESIFEIQYHYFETSNQITGRAKHFAPPGIGYYVATPSDWIFSEFQKEKTIEGKLDPRMYATFIWNYEGASIYQQPFEQFFSDNLDYIAWKKYQNWDLSVSEANLGRSSINERIMRLSHVLLMYAECLNEIGETEKAIIPVQRIRNRANLKELDNTITQEQLRLEIRHQRALEFCFEGERWYDIVRWEIGEHVFSTNLDRPNYTKGKYDFFPIPQSELDANPNLEQTKDW